MTTESSTENKAENQQVEVSDVKAADSSSAGQTVETPAKAETPADKGEKQPSLLEKVRTALKPKADKAPESDKPDTTKPDSDKPDDTVETEESGDLTDEETGRLKRKTKKRIDDLLNERAAKDKTIEEIRPKADRFDQVTKFFIDSQMSRDEVNQLFDVARNLKLSPRKAYEQLTPIYRQLQTMFGDILPEDLQQQVARGQINAERARELTIARTDRDLATQQAAQLRQQQAADAEQRQQEAYVSDVKAKVTEWELAREKSDPDWKLKQPFVMEAIAAELSKPGRKPPTAAEAIEIATAAVAKVDKNLKSFAPPRREVKPSPNASSTPSTPVPKSALEAARQGLAKARSAA